jgi:hypothetical protein
LTKVEDKHIKKRNMSATEQGPLTNSTPPSAEFSLKGLEEDLRKNNRGYIVDLLNLGATGISGLGEIRPVKDENVVGAEGLEPPTPSV